MEYVIVKKPTPCVPSLLGVFPTKIAGWIAAKP